MSNRKLSIETLASNLMIVIVIGFIASTALTQSIQNQSSARQQRLNAKVSMQLYQQQARFEASQARATQLWNGVRFALLFLLNAGLVLVLVAATGYLVYRLVILARKSTQSYFEWQQSTQHELRLEREFTKRLKYQYAPNKGLFHGLKISGNLTYNPTTRDSHDLQHSYTQHHKTPRSLGSGLPTGSSLDADFAPVIQMPTFSDMLALPTPQNHLALGYNEHASPVYMPITSQVVSGISGSGKSSTLTALCSQLHRQGAGIVLCDSHRDSEQGLTTKLAPVIDVLAIDSAESVDECKDAMAWTLEEFNQRRTSGNSKDSFKPLVWIVDEWLALLRTPELAAQAEHLAHTLTQEGRKMNMHFWACGQTFKAKHSTDVHHAIGQKIIGKQTPKEARLTTGMSSDMLPKDTLFLQAGESYLVSWNDPTPQKIYTPYADLNNFQPSCNDVAVMLQGTPKSQPIGFVRNSDETQTKVESKSLSTEEKRILRMFRGGSSLREIVQEVYSTKSGSKYNRHLSEVQELIRKQVV